MSKMIKLTDEVGAELERRAAGKPLAKYIRELLEGQREANLSERLDKMAVYIEKRFDALEKLFEDTTIDRLDSRPKRNVRVDMKWKDCQELFYDFMYDDDFASQKVLESVRAADDSFPCFIQEKQVFAQGNYGNELICNITPRIELFLKEKGYEV